MNDHVLLFIIQEGEGQFIEFREAVRHSDKDIVAFANASGGRLFIGITDDGIVKGIEVTNAMLSEVQDIARNCDPPIKIEVSKLKNVIIVNVPEGKDKPYKCKEGFFIRQGPNSQKMSREKIIDLAVASGKVRFDEQSNKDFNFKKDFDREKLNEYLQLAGLEKTIPEEEILINLGVAVREKGNMYFNNAGILFFAKTPGNFLFSSKVVCANYQTDEKTSILDRKFFDDGLIRNIENAVNYVKKHIDVEFVIKELARKEIPQYPEKAFREAIVNAVMHRDYLDDSGDVVVELLKTKLIVSNPGGLVKSLNPKEFGKISRTRNSLIASLLLRTKYVEKLGTGINRMMEEAKKLGSLPPTFEFNQSFFATLYALKGDEKVTEKVTENQRKMLSEISTDKYITLEKLSLLIGISERKIKENIAKLKKKGLLERIGPAKGGYWKVTLKNP